jgi:hypothetical protein
MKRFAFASLLVVFTLTFSLDRSTRAVADGSSANGGFQFTLGDGSVRYIQFHGRLQGNEASGAMTFTDPSAVLDPNDPQSPTGAQVGANFDCMKIEGNRAVMGGVISTSNIAAAIGLRVLLVVEDNGEGINQPAPDRLTWGVYVLPATGWIPKDAEREDDIGASLSWIAKDAERPDDVGIPSNRSQVVRCDSFSLSSYSFVDVPHGSGNIQVKP